MDGDSPHQTFYCFYCPPGVPREILLFKTENVYAMGMRPVYVICDPAHLLKTAFGGTGVKQYKYFLKWLDLGGATDLCEICCNNSLVVFPFKSLILNPL